MLSNAAAVLTRRRPHAELCALVDYTERANGTFTTNPLGTTARNGTCTFLACPNGLYSRYPRVFLCVAAAHRGGPPAHTHDLTRRRPPYSYRIRSFNIAAPMTLTIASRRLNATQTVDPNAWVTVQGAAGCLAVSLAVPRAAAVTGRGFAVDFKSYGAFAPRQ